LHCALEALRSKTELTPAADELVQVAHMAYRSGESEAGMKTYDYSAAAIQRRWDVSVADMTAALNAPPLHSATGLVVREICAA
jgi:hypothetical protein